MTSAKPILTVCLYAASCFAWTVIAAQTANSQEDTPTVAARSTTPAPQTKAGGWTASTDRWTPKRQISSENTNSLGIPTEPGAAFPQIKNPMQMPRLEQPEPNPNGAGQLHTPETCPECGNPMDSPAADTCGQCRRPLGSRLIHLFDPGRWLQNDSYHRTQREPWLYRPFSLGLFMGPIVGSPLLNNTINQGTGFLAGGRFGYDFDDDWGVEMRIASATIPISGSYPDASVQHSADHFLWDIDFLYYPWGDSAVRPYFLMGIGTARIKFVDQLNNFDSRILAGMPVGLGIKWKVSDWFIFRMECLDNVAFAGGSVFQTQHNASLTFGFEIRVGRPRVQYWPWDPGMRM